MSQVKIGRVLLNQYRVDELIGSGGVGLVYRVRDLQMNTDLAMKILNIDTDDDPSSAFLFKREAKAYENLAHPNIVRYYGLKHSEGIYFLLLDFIDGDSLQIILSRQPDRRLPIPDVLSLFKALSAALGYAHNNNVVHCDIKPGNILVDQGGKVYLTDFGIARHMESTATDIGAAGTIAYMAPEQFLKDPLHASTDIYSMGVLLYEMLVGQKPFRPSNQNTTDQSRTARELLEEAHLKEPPPDPCLIRKDLPADVGQVVIKAMQKDPKKRYQSTREFFSALCAAFGSSEDAVADRITQRSVNVFPQPPLSPMVTPVMPTPVKRSIPTWFPLGAVAAAGIIVVVLIASMSGESNGSVTSQSAYSPPSYESVPLSAPVNEPATGNQVYKTATPGSGQQEANLPAQATAIPVQKPTPTITPIAFKCPGMPVSRVKVGDKVEVCSLERLILREDPDKDGTIIRYFDPGTKGEIVNGPECADGSTWWKVVIKYNNKIYEGWMREGTDPKAKYFLCLDDEDS